MNDIRTLVQRAFETLAADEFLVDLGIPSQAPSSPDAEAVLLNALVESAAEMAAQHSELYDMVADQLRAGPNDLRDKLGPAVPRDFAHPGFPSSEIRGRERLYWLAIALADRATPPGHVDLRETLENFHRATRDHYLPLYRRWAEISGREPRGGWNDEGLGRLQAPLNTFLEGVVALRRAGRSLDEHDLISVVLALFYLFTRPIDGVASDPGEALVHGADPARVVPAGTVRSADTADDSYALAISALQAAGRRPAGIIRHASLHGLAGAPRGRPGPEVPPDLLRRVMLDLVDKGWTLHRLVTVHSEEDLEREIDAADQLAVLGKVRVHATVGGIGGHLATIIINEELAVLGLDDPHDSYVGRALLIEDVAASRFWVEHFSQVFDDRRHTLVIRSPAGHDSEGIAGLRRRVRDLARISARNSSVLLTDRQRDVIRLLSRVPRPQMQEIAAELMLSRERVKDICEGLYETFDIPKGRDRLGPLVEEIRSRGLI